MDVASLALSVDSTDVRGATSDVKDLIRAGMGIGAGFEGLKLIEEGFRRVTEYAKEAIMNAARFETLGVVLKVVGNNFNHASDEMDMFAKGLEKTGISMLEARQSLTRMTQAHIDLSRSSELARIAQDAAVVANINSSEAFQRMTLAIETGQVRMLRTLGINVTFNAAYQKLAATLGKTVQQLTEQEKVGARVDVVMSKGKDIAGAYEASMQTMGKQMLSAQRYVEDLSTSIGELLLPMAKLIVMPIIEWLKETSSAMKEFVDSANGKKFIDEMYRSFELVASMVTGIGSAIALVIGWINDIVPLIDLIKGAVVGALIYYTAQSLTVVAANVGIVASNTAAAASFMLLVAAALAIGAAFVYALDKMMGWSAETAKLDEQARQSEARQKNVTGPLLEEYEMLRKLTAERKAYEAAKTGGSSEKVAAQAAATARLVMEERKLFAQRTAAGWTQADFDWDASIKKRLKAEKDAQAVRDKAADDEAEAEAKRAQIRKKIPDEIQKSNMKYQEEVILFEKGAAAAELYTLMHEKLYSLEQAQGQVARDNAIYAMNEELRLTQALYAAGHDAADTYMHKEQALGKLNMAQIAYNGYLMEEIDLQKALSKNKEDIKSSHAAFDLAGVSGIPLSSIPGTNNSTKNKPKGFTGGSDLGAYYDVLSAVDPSHPASKQMQSLDKEAKSIQSFKAQLEALGLYDKAMQSVQQKQMALKASAGDTWAIIGTVVANSSQKATDALVNWMDNLNQAGYTWKNFGVTVAKVLEDIVIQMQKALIQQQLMGPLFNAMGLGIGGSQLSIASYNGAAAEAPALANFGGFFASGGDVSGTGPIVVGENGPEIFTPGRSGTVTPNSALGGVTNTNHINITVNGDGNTSTQASGKNAAALGNLVSAKVRDVIIQESRQGGLLSRT